VIDHDELRNWGKFVLDSNIGRREMLTQVNLTEDTRAKDGTCKKGGSNKVG